MVLKVTVPKRTGRKRKRGTDGPWEGEVDMRDVPRASPGAEPIYSRSRLDNPKLLRRKMRDNVDRYSVKAVGVIKHTHRFRGEDMRTSNSPTPTDKRQAWRISTGASSSPPSFRDS